MHNGQEKIGILIFNYPVAFSPTILDTALYWAKANYHVDLITDRVIFADIERLSPFIKIHYCGNRHPIGTIKNTDDLFTIEKKSSGLYENIKYNVNRFVLLRSLLKFYRLNNLNIVFKWSKNFLIYLNGARIICRNRDYKFFIGFEPEGLIAAYWLSKRDQRTFYYHSLELYEPNCLKDKFRKYFEKIANKKSLFTVIQDSNRARELMRTNGIDKENISIMPVSAFGPVIESQADYLRNRYKIGANKKIILYLGGISSDMCCLEIAEQTASTEWADNWVMVFHGFSADTEYISNILSVSRKDRFFLSIDTISINELNLLTCSADIGIALYRQNNKNNEFTIFSSGKIAQYYKCGLPVIVNTVKQNEEFISNFQSGFCVEQPTDIHNAIKEISLQYPKYRKGAFDAFNKRYNFEKNYSYIAESICNNA